MSESIPEALAGELAREGAAAFELPAPGLSLLQNMVNATFVAQDVAEKVRLRISRDARRSREELESEAALLDALNSGGFRVPAPRRTKGGDWVWTAADGAHHVTVAGWLPGAVLPTEQRSVEHFRRIGAELGRLHAFVGGWIRPHGFRRPTHFAVDVFGGVDALGIAPDVRADLDRAQAAVRAAEEQPAGVVPRGLIHGDASFGNVLFDGDEPALIDFDDCGEGVLAFDLAVVLAGAWGKPDFVANAEALCLGYERHRPLGPPERAVIPAMMAARAATMLLWAARQSPTHPWITAQHERLVAYLATTI